MTGSDTETLRLLSLQAWKAYTRECDASPLLTDADAAEVESAWKASCEAHDAWREAVESDASKAWRL